MKILRLLLRNWRLLLSALTAGTIIHIWTTLNAVRSGETSGYTQLAAKLPINQISYLPAVTPQNQRLPFMMPDTRYAICRFDTSNAHIRIRAEIPAPGWSLSLHAPNGDNFLYVPGNDDRVTKLNIVLKPPGKTFEAKTIGPLAPAKKSPEISLKQTYGLAIYKAPVTALALRRLIDEQLSTFECFQERKRS